MGGGYPAGNCKNYEFIRDYGVIIGGGLSLVSFSEGWNKFWQSGISFVRFGKSGISLGMFIKSGKSLIRVE
ncbi:hypothetical protein NERG_02432 [Nematocida ausubeli]|uniref:Uncharacterized protein n=1 Tax=Nematocida ausubeli (strain ATCC PRA-371 / ERTm2) TaxID=1913371 RepID=H8ZFR1_NEMA1|nr:hypothetical protein NERG_02432 [Nematocida ausubeli]